LNAKVRLTGAATAEASTAPDGAFTLPALPPGKYKLTVEAEGRKVAYAQTIDLTPAAPVELITLSNRGEIEVAEQQQTRHDPASTFPESRSRCWKRWQQPGSR
jgi:hypothetical protein